MFRSIIVLLSMLVFLTACTEGNVQTENVVRPVRAFHVGAQEEFSKRKFPGRAAASNAVTLAFEVSGKLNEIPVAVGDRVKKGDVLATIDARDFRNTLDQSRAELKRAKAQYDRMLNALADNAVSKQDVTNAEAAYESAKATVNIHQKALDDTRLVAPYDAIVSSKQIKSFGNVQAKQPAIRIVNPERIEMETDIPSDIISMAKEGMDVLVVFDDFPNTVIHSKISEIAAEASPATRTYSVTLLMDQPEDVTILPGMAGKAWRAPQTKPGNTPLKSRGFEVPLNAILAGTDGKSYVWVIEQETGEVSRTVVQPGELTQHGVLVQGLKGGEFIASAGVNSLSDGQKVRITRNK
ncbi:efflux RND transporter periplasmic adaptor subunit [bacterium SCSIO 12696]|nr:efflux RND transporter periplasmic adaptor subunit [bacterium SCSIO 12696]